MVRTQLYLDALMAAAASTTGLQLWTLNRQHFPMDDLRLFAPSEN
jgi:predicted nucleic acid-binding protein